MQKNSDYNSFRLFTKRVCFSLFFFFFMQGKNNFNFFSIFFNSQIQFSPPLPNWKLDCIDSLGIGLINTTALIFPKAFWANFTVIGCPAETPFYIYNIYKCTKQTILLALFIGDQAYEVEKKTDAQIVDEIMVFLKKVFLILFVYLSIFYLFFFF